MPIKITIIDPDKTLFEGTAEYLMAPGVRGMLGIFPSHTPLFAELIKGEIFIKSDKEELVALEGGIMRVRNDEVTILIDKVEVTS